MSGPKKWLVLLSMIPDSPLRLAIWLVVLILVADTAGLPQEITAVIAVIFTVCCGWLIVRKRKSEDESASGDRSFLGTNTPLYTYGLLGFGLASVLAIVGLMTTGVNLVTRLVEWDWEGFGLSSLGPLIPAALVAAVSLAMIMTHVLRTLHDEDSD